MSPEETLEAVRQTLQEQTGHTHGDCKAPMYECLEVAFQDLHTKVRFLTNERDAEGATAMRLINENRLLRRLVHQLTAEV
jgi:hypothetical protein